MREKYLKNLEFYKILEQAQRGCVCPEAAARMRQVTACTDLEEMRHALRMTDAITTRFVRLGAPRLARVEGILEIVRRAEKGGLLSMGELLAVGRTLRNFEALNSWYRTQEDKGIESSPVLDDLFYGITENAGLSRSIFDSILSETEMADTASDALYEIRRKIKSAENSIREKLEGMIKSPSTQKYLQDAVVSLRSGRFVVPVKAEYRGEIPGVIHDVSASGATLFVEPGAVVELNARILQLKSQEQEEIERILTVFSGAVAAMQPLFGVSYEAMLQIDQLLAKAKLAADQAAAMPQVVE